MFLCFALPRSWKGYGAAENPLWVHTLVYPPNAYLVSPHFQPGNKKPVAAALHVRRVCVFFSGSTKIVRQNT